MATFISGGETVVVRAESAWAARLVARAIGQPAPRPDRAGDRAGAAVDTTATVRITIQAGSAPFDRSGMRPVTRGAYGDGRRTVLRDAGGSGFDLLVTAGDDLDVVARYRPRPLVRLANRLLPARFALLAGQVLVHYPVLWRAGWRGRVPLHVCVVRAGHGTALLAGPGGVGKTTVLAGLLAAGAIATADNLCAADDVTCFGLAEPLRTDWPVAASGPDAVQARRGLRRLAGRTSHGRVEVALPGRVPALRPDRVVVLRRGPDTRVTPVEPAAAARALVAGTYAAGELRRYWAFAATLALATGRGPAHPPIGTVAAGYAGRLPCVRVCAGDGARLGEADLFGGAGTDHGGADLFGGAGTDHGGQRTTAVGSRHPTRQEDRR